MINPLLSKKTLVISLVLVTVSALASPSLTARGQAAASEAPKQVITTIDQLPRHTYKISSTVTALLSDEKAFTALARHVRRDMEKDLETYDIRDKTTLGEYYNILVTLDLLQGNYDAALAGVKRMRELEDKPAAKLMKALPEEVMALARQEAKNREGDEFQEIFVRRLKEKVEKLPWKTVRDSILEARSRMEIYNRNFLLGVVQSQFDPVAQKTGEIGSDIARQVIRIYYFFTGTLPLKDQFIKVYGEFIDAHRVVKPDIWKDRQVDLTGRQGLSPVIVAIWDTGVDISVFPGQLYTNPGESPDGKDNDANGFVDDVHGIAYTLDHDKTPELLYQIEGGAKGISGKVDIIKGFEDLSMSVDSPEATAFKKKLAALPPPEIKTLLEDLMKGVLYIHGTHVAGIAIAGNPYARILVTRLSVDYHQIPRPITMKDAVKTAKMLKEVVAYYKAQGVRVVNMSWDISFKEIEKDLESNGIGKDARERTKMARQLFDVQKEAFREAIKNAPEIVFVNAAGNDDDDPAFQDCIPTAIDLPNVLVAGAVDQAGDETTFTSSGTAVDVYANGYNVESLIPGGQTMAASGTSMSSPQVANLAAKLLALAPQLKAKDVVDLIIAGADKSKDGRILLINPQRSVQLLESKQK